MSESVHKNFERHASDWHEFSTDVSDRHQDGTLIGKPERLFVRSGADCGMFISIVQAKVTSDTATGRELEGQSETLLLLTDDLADWLISSLTKARAAHVESPEADVDAVAVPGAEA